MPQSITPASKPAPAAPTMEHVAMRARLIRDENLSLAKHFQIGMAAAWTIVPATNLAIAFIIAGLLRLDTTPAAIAIGAASFTALCWLSILGLFQGAAWKERETVKAHAIVKAAEACIAEAELALSLDQAEHEAMDIARSVCLDAQAGLFARSLQGKSTQGK